MTIRRTFGALLIFLAFTIISASKVGADSPSAAKVELCIACHGDDGIGRDPTWPNLAGQKEAYLVTQIKAFRDGARENEIMKPVLVELSDADIERLAEYYSKLGRAPRDNAE